MKKVFIAASFVAAFLTGCPGPNPPSELDGGPLPGDASRDTGNPDIDGGALEDAGVPEDGNVIADASIPCGDHEFCPVGMGCDPDRLRCVTLDELCQPDYLGWPCALPRDMVYNAAEFTCEEAINSDLWGTTGGGTIDVGISNLRGQIVAGLSFALGNANFPNSPGNFFVCGNEGKCWMNWYNSSSTRPRCTVSFSTDCIEATVLCYRPGDTMPAMSRSYYAGPI